MALKQFLWEWSRYLLRDSALSTTPLFGPRLIPHKDPERCGSPRVDRAAREETAHSAIFADLVCQLTDPEDDAMGGDNNNNNKDLPP